MKNSASLVLGLVFLTESPVSLQQRSSETFKTELFLNKNDVNSGLYEGDVKGRRRFGETQVPHGEGTIYYFSNDKFNRVNYTGDWADGERAGNGTTSFRDGAVYQGEYKDGLEHGRGFIRYTNGNTLDAEFVGGKIVGHGVFRYASGDQREGFFKDNILDGQVIFTSVDGRTVIETWSGGEKIDDNAKEDVSSSSAAQIGSDQAPAEVENNSIEIPKASRGGNIGRVWGITAEKEKVSVNPKHDELITRVRSRARSFLFEIYSDVN